MLTNDPFPDVPGHLAQNPAIANFPGMLAILTDDEDDWARCHLATSNALAGFDAVVSKLAGDNDPFVRTLLARNRLDDLVSNVLCWSD